MPRTLVFEEVTSRTFENSSTIAELYVLMQRSFSIRTSSSFRASLDRCGRTDEAESVEE